MIRMTKRTVLSILGGAAVLYGACTAGFYLAMNQPPERFGAVMSKTPAVAMMIFPFEPLWMHARAGTLHEGDRAPDFTLPALDHSRNVTLSAEARERPVVLIFGSYT